MTIRHAQELASRLEGDLAEGVPVSVETGGLVDIDTCILQLLCALRKTVPALSFESPSEAFAAAVERTGLRRELLGAREAS
jgi:anti-anti-sigma regulatory factor